VLEDVSKAVCDGLNEAMTHYKSFLKSDALSQNSPFQGDALLDPDAAYFATLHEIKKDIMEDAKGGQRFRSREEKRRKLNDAISTGSMSLGGSKRTAASVEDVEDGKATIAAGGACNCTPQCEPAHSDTPHGSHGFNCKLIYEQNRFTGDGRDRYGPNITSS